MAPADDAQGAAGAIYAEHQGARRVFVLNDNEPYGFGVAEAFRLAAERLGLRVVGRAKWDPKASEYRALASRVEARARHGVPGRIPVQQRTRLIKHLRETLGPEGRSSLPTPGTSSSVIEGAGAAAEGFAQ